MKAPLSKPTVKLIGQDGNAFTIMGNIKQALKRAGGDPVFNNAVNKFYSSDYFCKTLRMMQPDPPFLSATAQLKCHC